MGSPKSLVNLYMAQFGSRPNTPITRGQFVIGVPGGCCFDMYQAVWGLLGMIFIIHISSVVTSEFWLRSRALEVHLCEKQKQKTCCNHWH
jgi:hypothetical protein